MRKSALFIIVSASCLTALGESPSNTVQPAGVDPSPHSTQPPQAKLTSPQEMLVTGPPMLKMHALAIVSQEKYRGKGDESYLPGLKTCAMDPSTSIRSVTARALGILYIQGVKNPNPDALALLVQLANDSSDDVRYRAVYYGLSQLEHKPEEIILLLLEIASAHCEQSLYECIVDSLDTSRDQVADILETKISTGDISAFEIYEDFTGKRPSNAEQFLDMPSSRPRLFVFQTDGTDAEADEHELRTALQSAGIENPLVQPQGIGDSYILLVSTYITRDAQIVDEKFSENRKFKLTQSVWLTPEQEAELEAMRKTDGGE